MTAMARLRRVIVGGITGAGETTLARRIATLCGLTHVELDSMYHGPDWQPRPAFDADTDAATRGDGWVVDSTGYPIRDGHAVVPGRHLGLARSTAA
jgi:adenylate kinase family enzyme